MSVFDNLPTENDEEFAARKKRQQKKTVYISVGIVAVMLGLSLVSSPLYRAFCRVTGFAGTPLRAVDLPKLSDEERAAAAATPRIIAMRFNGNVEPGLDWRFQPTENVISVKVGQNNMAYFEAENLTNDPITGVASFNVTPLKAAPYIVKIACFCFNQQTLAANQKQIMPISFYIDPSIRKDRTLDDVTSITMSYSFFRSTTQAPPPFRKI